MLTGECNSAHLRTYDDTSSPLASSASSLSGVHDPDHEKKDWEAEKRNGRIMKLYKKPTVRQYFHKGLLWRASGSTEVQSFELFIDLLYVGILALNGDHAADDPTGYELLRFSITFIMSWYVPILGKLPTRTSREFELPSMRSG
jgi:hypothetical protein